MKICGDSSVTKYCVQSIWRRWESWNLWQKNLRVQNLYTLVTVMLRICPLQFVVNHYCHLTDGKVRHCRRHFVLLPGFPYPLFWCEISETLSDMCAVLWEHCTVVGEARVCLTGLLGSFETAMLEDNGLVVRRSAESFMTSRPKWHPARTSSSASDKRNPPYHPVVRFRSPKLNIEYPTRKSSTRFEGKNTDWSDTMCTWWLYRR
jgi:hypothetical protein